jgi:hypothetical protein
MNQKGKQRFQRLAMKIPFFLDTRNAMVAAYKTSFMIIQFAVGALAMAPAAGVGAGAATAVAAAAATATEEGTGTAIEVVLACEEGGQAAVEAALTTAGEAPTVFPAGSGTMMAWQGMWSAPAVKAATAVVAGALLVVGTPKNAGASTSPDDGDSTSSGPKPVLEDPVVIRAVSITDFQPVGSLQSASSKGPPDNFRHTPETARGKFYVNMPVLFDNARHYILATATVR